MAQPLLSVIIPVYNAQDTLGTALDSVRNQGISELEILLVNDGSKDKSLLVCQEYALQDARIRVIHQENAGPGAARNTGLKEATGQYISFVDSDDSLQPGAYQRMLGAARNDGSDLVIAHFNILLNNQVLDRGYIKGDECLDHARFYDELAHRPGSYYYSALWNKLYSRQIIEENGLSFSHELSWGEDFDFNMRYYKHVRAVSFVKEPVYNYKRTYSGQTWRTMFEVYNLISIKSRLYKSLKALYRHAGLFERYRLHIYRYIFNVTIST